MKRTLLDIRDLDFTWWKEVEAYRDGGVLHLPRHSVERLGELDPATGDAWLVDGTVAAKANLVEISGQETLVWSVRLEQLVTRPSRTSGRSGRGH